MAVRPIIGITTYAEPSVRWGVWEVPAAVLPLAYVEAIQRAGGRALLIPPSDEGVEETLAAVDGLLFSGGSDIGPDEYGHELHPETVGVRPERDRGELALLQAALERDIPLLAVCRGSQVLNVARGGDLVQHLPEVVGDERHKHAPGVFSDHEVRVESSSKLGELVGEHRHVPRERALEQRQLATVALRTRVRRLRVRVRAIAAGIEVVAAGEEQSVERVEGLLESFLARRDDQRTTARTLDRVHVHRRDERRLHIPRSPLRGLDVGRDSDQRSLSHVRTVSPFRST